MNKKNTFTLFVLFAFVASLALTSCGSTKRCDGKKATKTRMGNM